MRHSFKIRRCRNWDRTQTHSESCMSRFPTGPFTILEPQDQEIGEFHVVWKHHGTDFESRKLWIGGSGSEIQILSTLSSISFSSLQTNIFNEPMKWAYRELYWFTQLNTTDPLRISSRLTLFRALRSVVYPTDPFTTQGICLEILVRHPLTRRTFQILKNVRKIDWLVEMMITLVFVIRAKKVGVERERGLDSLHQPQKNSCQLQP